MGALGVGLDLTDGLGAGAGWLVTVLCITAACAASDGEDAGFGLGDATGEGDAVGVGEGETAGRGLHRNGLGVADGEVVTTGFVRRRGRGEALVGGIGVGRILIRPSRPLFSDGCFALIFGMKLPPPDLPPPAGGGANPVLIGIPVQ
jgi:hypothetical protein